MQTGPLIQANSLAKHYLMRGGGPLFRRQYLALRAVDNVTLRINAGETLGLVGESGCGKSTLGRLLIRLIEPSTGTVLFQDDDITQLSGKALRARRRAMQIIFQDPYGALDPRLSVEHIIAEPLLIHGMAAAEARQTVTRMLNLVGLPARVRDRFPHEFSGGQRQRIGIARALALHPSFVVCDEPVSALDVSVQAQIINLLVDLQRELGLTYLFIAHDLAVVKHISTRVAVMYLGKVVETAPKRDLYARPLHPYTQALIAAVPVSHPTQRAAGHARRQQIAGDIPSALHPPSGCRFHTRCPHVMPTCRVDEPVMLEAAQDHFVACHLYDAAVARVGAPN